MSTTAIPDRFTALPDEHALQATVTALEEHGFSVEVVGDLDAAREAVLARSPAGYSVMTHASVTLAETEIADAIYDGDRRCESARNKMLARGFATQAQQMKAIGGQPDYALGSVHAVTRDGTLVIASASGSQLASYAWGAAKVIFVAGAQKLVPTLEAGHQRVYQHILPLEDARVQAAYGQHSQVGKILEIHTDCPAGSTSSSSASRSASEPLARMPCSLRLTELVLRHLGTDGLHALISQMSRLGSLPPNCLEEQPEGDTKARSG